MFKHELSCLGGFDMADDEVELRLTKLEREMVMLREHRVGNLEREWANIPDLIDLRFRQVDSKFSRVFAEMDDLKKDVVEVKRDMVEVKGRLGMIDDRLDALPRILAEMLAERDRRG
jgi:hypothetical protein